MKGFFFSKNCKTAGDKAVSCGYLQMAGFCPNEIAKPATQQDEGL
jgi:hypothetical protein